MGIVARPKNEIPPFDQGKKSAMRGRVTDDFWLGSKKKKGMDTVAQPTRLAKKQGHYLLYISKQNQSEINRNNNSSN